jgi:hypothetical protein
MFHVYDLLLFKIFAVITGIRSLSKFSALNLFHMYVLYFKQIFLKHFEKKTEMHSLLLCKWIHRMRNDKDIIL